MEIKKIACVGAGMVGSSWATLFSKEGHCVKLYDGGKQQLERSEKNIQDNFKMLKEHHIMTEEQIKEALQRITYIDSLEEAIKDADLIQESIFEDLSAKQAILAEIDRYNTRAVVCSSTSALKISSISQNSAYAHRCIGAHPYNPPHLMPLVEITKWEKTDDQYVKAAYDFYKSVKKEPVVLKKESLGFIGNRLQYAYIREAIDLVMNGVADVEDVDKVSLYGLGMRYAILGPNLICDLNGGENGLKEYYERFGDTINSCLQDNMAVWTEIPKSFGEEIGPKGIEAEKEHRSKEQGNTREEIAKYRDKLLLEILKLHHKI